MSKDWYPIINYENCTQCQICYEFCNNEVYEWEEDKGPMVVKPEGCIDKCHGCEFQCPGGAIRYHGDLPGKRVGGALIIEF